MSRGWIYGVFLIGLAAYGAFSRLGTDPEPGDGPPVSGVILDDAVALAKADAEEESDSPGLDVDTSGALAVAPTAESVPEESQVVQEPDERPGGGAVETAAAIKAEELIATAEQEKSPIERAKLLSDALRCGGLSESRESEVYDDLMAANRRGICNPRNDDGCQRVTVEPGDSLWKICQRMAAEGATPVAPGLIQLVNQLADQNRIFEGQRLKVPLDPLSIRIEKGKFQATVQLGEIILRRYIVGLGKDDRTPEGEFEIGSRLKNPAWMKPGVGKVEPDDPENVLGTRWLGFKALAEFPEAVTFGLHGTREPDSIGQEQSNGCIRMLNEDVEELFEWVAEDVKVEIVP